MANATSSNYDSEIWTSHLTGEMVSSAIDNAKAAKVDGEIHLCGDCYEKIEPIFRNYNIRPNMGIKEEDEEERSSLWDRILHIFT